MNLKIAAAALLIACSGLPAAALAQSQPSAPNYTHDPREVKAGEYVLDSAHGKITWVINHQGYSSFVGHFTGVKANLTYDASNVSKMALSVTVDINNVATLVPELDEHLKTPDFFDAAKFPAATFKATRFQKTGAKTAKVTGELTLHGVTKPFTMEVSFNQAGSDPFEKQYRVGFTGKGVLKRSDYGMKQFLPAIGDSVALEMEGEFVEAR
ncbi:Polyisoprenoid-binding protein YceI [Faunimonas pinastri]|uniref:Polyisoprenoid-binding protein YceI n=1 Tax=Faunimonas pinastri TaxID=1855383 RepID=A0A1H9FP81_9HYPH|nr:YceI family protein [Faunimonas pinastri]SEQ39800.1 Polyisoprenoid-binding protein YceI [Faunimonas pinastri]